MKFVPDQLDNSMPDNGMPDGTPDRMIDAVESASAEASLAVAADFTPDQLRRISAMRRQRAILQDAGERMQRSANQAGATDKALDRLALAMKLEPSATHDPVELVPRALPISAFRVVRQPVWQRVVASGWPMRFAAAACVGLVAYVGIVGFSAAQARYVSWQQERATRAAQLAQAAANGNQPTLAPAQTEKGTVVAAQIDPAAVVPVELATPVQPVVVAAAAPATNSELARTGQLVILVRAKSAGQVNASISGLAKRASEVIAVAPAEAGWQGQVIASATAALADSPGSAMMAGFAPQLAPGRPILVSYGPMAQSAVPTAARASVGNHATGSGAAIDGGFQSNAVSPLADSRFRLADWFASRQATTHVLTLRDQPDAIERLIRRLGGSRGVTVELVRLDAPLPEVRLSAGQNVPTAPATGSAAGSAAGSAVKPGANAAALDSLMWWTRPAGQWQRLEIPVVVVEQ